MKLEQYRHRQIRAYVAEALRSGHPINICDPPEGTFFKHRCFSLIPIMSIDLWDFKTKKRIIGIAHDHTRHGDIWVAPIDATRASTIENPYIQIIRERLLKKFQ